MNEPLEVSQIAGNTVGQGAFEIRPNELIRIEFGRISREPVDVEPGMSAEKFLGHLPPVRLAVVPEENHLSAKVTQELAQKSRHFWSLDVLPGMETGIKGQAPPSRRDGKGRDGRNLVPMHGTTQDRRLTTGGPGSMNCRNQQESSFVEENEVGSESFGFFYMRPDVALPMLNSLLVPFPSFSLRSLAAPPQGLQEPPQVVGMILDPKLLPYYLRHTTLSP